MLESNDIVVFDDEEWGILDDLKHPLKIYLPTILEYLVLEWADMLQWICLIVIVVRQHCGLAIDSPSMI